LKGDFPVYAAEVNLNIACKSYFHILQPFVFAKVISAAPDFGVEITFSNEFYMFAFNYFYLPLVFFLMRDILQEMI
jgi:hypothetical protein